MIRNRCFTYFAALASLSLACVAYGQGMLLPYGPAGSTAMVGKNAADGKFYVIAVDANGIIQTSGSTSSGTTNLAGAYRGGYNSATTYSAGDIATYSGSSYVALLGSSSSSPQTPGSAPTYWGVLATGGAVSSMTTTGTGGAPTLIAGVLNIPAYDPLNAASTAQGAAATDATAKINALRPTVTAGTGGVAINTLVSKDGTSNPVRYVTAAPGACGSPALASAASGSTFMLADAIGTWSVLTDSGGAVANHLLTGSTITPGTLADTGQTESANIPSTTCIAGTAQATVAGGALATVLPHARGSYGRLLLAQNVTRDATLVTPNLGSFPITVPTTTVICFDGDSTTAGGQGSPATSSMATIFATTPLGAAIAAGGASHVVSYAVAGQNYSTIYARYSTSCHNVRPGVTLGDGTVVGKAYFVFWTQWNNNSDPNSANLVVYSQREYAQAKADGFVVVGATAMHDPRQPNGTELTTQTYNQAMRGLANFYQTTTVSACITANLCGWDYLADYESLIPDLTQPAYNSGGTIVYPYVASDLRHPSNMAMLLQANYLSNLLITGFDFLPKVNPFRPFGEVLSTSATAAIPVYGDLVTITLAANYSPTWAAPINQYQSQQRCIQFVQDATGTRTVTWPANVLKGFTPDPTANKRSMQCFHYSWSQTAYVADSPGSTNY